MAMGLATRGNCSWPSSPAACSPSPSGRGAECLSPVLPGKPGEGHSGTPGGGAGCARRRGARGLARAGARLRAGARRPSPPPCAQLGGACVSPRQLKQMAELEQEEEVLLQGLQMMARGRDWYRQQLQRVQERQRRLGRNRASAVSGTAPSAGGGPLTVALPHQQLPWVLSSGR